MHQSELGFPKMPQNSQPHHPGSWQGIQQSRGVNCPHNQACKQVNSGLEGTGPQRELGVQELLTTSLSTWKPRRKSNRNCIWLLPAKTKSIEKAEKQLCYFLRTSNCHTLFAGGKCWQSHRKSSWWLAGTGPVLGDRKTHYQQSGWGHTCFEG